jgi:hypothetical protein
MSPKRPRRFPEEIHDKVYHGVIESVLKGFYQERFEEKVHQVFVDLPERADGHGEYDDDIEEYLPPVQLRATEAVDEQDRNECQDRDCDG